ncbi:MAG: SH3 domain-containing protein [Lachnospiraceae bacterium]|nr:SH3 domain-containing protein [Lachnospiraceae bacterium]
MKKSNVIKAISTAAVVGIAVLQLSFTSFAATAGKVTGDSVKIRKEASTSSSEMGRANKDTSVTINGQVTGSDGKVWYQISYNGGTAYIRSDFVSITDGSTPETLTTTATTNGATTANSTTTTTNSSTTSNTATTSETPANVTAVNPISATIKGGNAVRVRANASTTSNIQATVASGETVTVTGTATSSDGKTWYQVSFTKSGSEVTGFVREDYLDVDTTALSEASAEPSIDVTELGETGGEAEPEVTEETDARYEVRLVDGDWKLIDNEGGENGSGVQYSIEKTINAVDSNEKLYTAEKEKADKFQIIVIVLAIIVILMAAVLTWLIFKLKDSAVDRDFSEAGSKKKNAPTARSERARSADRPARSADRERSRERGERSARSLERDRSARRELSEEERAARRARREGGEMRRERSEDGRSMQRPAQGRTIRPDGRPTRPSSERPVSVERNEERRPSSEQLPTENVTAPEYSEINDPEKARTRGERPERPERSDRPARNEADGRPAKRRPNSFNGDEDDDLEFEYLNWDGDEE